MPALPKCLAPRLQSSLGLAMKKQKKPVIAADWQEKQLKKTLEALQFAQQILASQQQMVELRLMVLGTFDSQREKWIRKLAESKKRKLAVRPARRQASAPPK